MRVLELRDESRLRLEPAHERGPVDELGADHLDRDLAPDRRLVGAIHDADVAAPDLLAELVAPHRAAEGADRWAAAGDRSGAAGSPRGGPSSRSWKTCCGLPMPLNRNSPRAFACQPPRDVDSAACASAESSTCPPCAAASIRPARFITGRSSHRRAPRPPRRRPPCGRADQAVPVRVGEQALDLAARGDGRADIGEREVDAVADALHDPSSRRLGRAEHDPVVLGDHGAHVRLHSQRTVESSTSVSRKATVCTWLRLEQERRVLVEDRPLELLQLRRGLEASSSARYVRVF